jgi:hypothetical protein
LFFAFLLSFLLSSPSSRIYYFDQTQPDLPKERWGIRHGNDGWQRRRNFVFRVRRKKNKRPEFFSFSKLKIKTKLFSVLFSIRPARSKQEQQRVLLRSAFSSPPPELKRKKNTSF